MELSLINQNRLRFLITNESCWILQIARLLKDNFPNESIPTC